MYGERVDGSIIQAHTEARPSFLQQYFPHHKSWSYERT